MGTPKFIDIQNYLYIFQDKVFLKSIFNTFYYTVATVPLRMAVSYTHLDVYKRQFGAMGTGCGATDMATILMTGELWFRIPEIIEVRLEGETKKGVYRCV